MIVCTENLNSDVVMVKPAEDRVGTNDSGLMNRTRNRRILVRRPMRSDGVVVIGIRFQNPAQMCLARDNDVVQTLAPDRSDQPFGKAILPGEAAAIGLSRMPMARNRRVTTHRSDRD